MPLIMRTTFNSFRKKNQKKKKKRGRNFDNENAKCLSLFYYYDQQLHPLQYCYLYTYSAPDTAKPFTYMDLS